MNKLMKKVKNKKGFTLIELIVVIAILGILAAIAIPRLSGFTKQANEQAVETSIRTVESAAAMYYAEYNAFPADIAKLVQTGYLDETPFDDNYTFNADGSLYGTPKLK